MRRDIFMSLILIVLVGINDLFAQNLADNVVREKLMKELNRYSIVYDEYRQDNMPILMGNTEMGGLADPLGRGIFNIEMANLWDNPFKRSLGSGMMLKIAQFAGLRPIFYEQKYSLSDGILSTRVGYQNGAYSSEFFFSLNNKELIVYTLTNNGTTPLICNIDMGLYELQVKDKTNKSIYAESKEKTYTTLHYKLLSNIPLQEFASVINIEEPFAGFNRNIYTPDSKDAFFFIAPNETVELVLQLRVGKEQIQEVNSDLYNVAELKKAHIEAWKNSWKQMAIVLLPEGEYAKTYYRSLHWLQCVAGSEKFLPGETQFATLTSRIASEYGYFSDKINLTENRWFQHAFTYGGAGWSAFAYTWIGDKKNAYNIINNMYVPDVLHKNATITYPIGEKEVIFNDGKSKGTFKYLKKENPLVFCFGHELLDNGMNIHFNNHPWDWQIHIQGFGSSLFYNYNKLFAGCSDTTYAVLKGIAEFWSEILHFNKEENRFTLSPVVSLTEDLMEPDILDGLLAAKWSLSEASDFAKNKELDKELREKWSYIAKNIKIKNKDGIYLEYANDSERRLGGGYQGIRGYAYLGFPVMELGPSLSKEYVSNSLDMSWIRNKKGEGMITFIANWFALTDAYWGRSEDAYEKSSYCLSQLDPSKTAMCEVGNRNPYYLASYASFTMVPIAMILQTVGDVVSIFPAVPKVWKDIEFYGLPAIYGLRVSGAMKDGKVQWIIFRKDGEELLRLSEKAKIKVTEKNGEMQFKKVN